MRGRTKSFYEDVFVLLILFLLGLGGYLFFFSEKEETLPNSSTVQSQPTQKMKENPNIAIEQPLKDPPQHENNDTEVIKSDRSDATDAPQTIDQPQKEVKTSEKVIESVTKDLENNQTSTTNSDTSSDMQLLQRFLIDTKQKIKNSIVLQKQESENNKNSIRVSIRVTVLKNGDFEQLVYTGGDQDLFKNNYKNIVALFPLSIDEKIMGEFPRYLRYSFKFTLKEE